MCIGQLSDEIECPSGYTCDNEGQCVITPVCTDGQRTCVSDSIYSCAAGQWQLFFHCPSDNDCTESAGTAYCAQENRTQPAQPTQPTQPTQPASGGLGDLGIVFVGTTVLLGAAVIYFIFFRK
ncbi:MAG: hypothetical protein NTY83_03180 [Candidatus Micrarchaeota archaeon]|nr:hypothetical protein [Candidatus Micrarchaeota archaeon]